VYRWIPHGFWNKKTRRPNPNNFRGLESGGVSVEWSRFSDPETCKNHSIDSSDVGVVQLGVDKVKQIDLLKVKHRPEPEHPEHSLILAENIDRDILQTKLELVNICEWAIEPPNE